MIERLGWEADRQGQAGEGWCIHARHVRSRWHVCCASGNQACRSGQPPAELQARVGSAGHALGWRQTSHKKVRRHVLQAKGGSHAARQLCCQTAKRNRPFHPARSREHQPTAIRCSDRRLNQHARYMPQQSMQLQAPPHVLSPVRGAARPPHTRLPPLPPAAPSPAAAPPIQSPGSAGRGPRRPR